MGRATLCPQQWPPAPNATSPKMTAWLPSCLVGEPPRLCQASSPKTDTLKEGAGPTSRPS